MDLIGHFFMDNFGSELSQETLQIVGGNTITIKEINFTSINGLLVTAAFEFFTAKLMELLMSNIGFGIIGEKTELKKCGTKSINNFNFI